MSARSEADGPQDRPRLVVVLPLWPLAVGDAFTLRDWPLHVTVVPTFVIAGGLTGVLGAAAPVLAAQPAVSLVVGRQDGFGHAATIPVRLIEHSAELSRLHGRLVEALRTVGAEFDHPEFVGAGYRPHVTMKGDAGVGLGERLTLEQASVVDMAPEGERRLRKVVWTTELRPISGTVGGQDLITPG